MKTSASTAVRSLLFLFFAAFSMIFIGILCLPVAFCGRQPARSIVRIWSKMIMIALEKIAGISCTLEGTGHIPAGGALIAANHQSMWETIALNAILPRPVMVMKKELTRIPVYGWWARASGCIAIDRKAGAGSLRALRKQAVAAIGNGEQVVIFPEGTRHAPGTRAPFRPGVAGIIAAMRDVPCIPVAHDSGRFWHYPGIWKTPGNITLKFLPPAAPAPDSRTFLKNLRQTIEKARPDLADDRHS